MSATRRDHTRVAVRVITSWTPPEEAFLRSISRSCRRLSIQLLRSRPLCFNNWMCLQSLTGRFRESDFSQSYVSGITAVNNVFVWRWTCGSADQHSSALVCNSTGSKSLLAKEYEDHGVLVDDSATAKHQYVTSVRIFAFVDLPYTSIKYQKSDKTLREILVKRRSRIGRTEFRLRLGGSLV